MPSDGCFSITDEVDDWHTPGMGQKSAIPAYAHTTQAADDLCLAKALRVRRFNDLGPRLRVALFAMIP